MLRDIPSIHNLPKGHISYCQICGSNNLEFILDLGHQPPCDSLLSPEKLNEKEVHYPLRLVFCNDCSLAQIDYVVDPKILFHPDYPYISGITSSLKQLLHSISDEVHKRITLNKDDLVVDIGSNDGTLLTGFQRYGCRVLGIEPTNVADIANRNAVTTMKSFFNKACAEKLTRDFGKARVVTATNMFAHVMNLGELISGVSDILEEGGVFLTESHYLMNILEDVQYDSIYHEHLKYYSLKSLIALFDSYDFTVTDAMRIPNYGGSIRVFATKGRNHDVSSNIFKMLEEERRAGIYEVKAFHEFREKVFASRMGLTELMSKLSREGRPAPGIGCPGRSSTLINYCSIDTLLMPYIAEQSGSLKLGLHLPGKHIPIKDEAILLEQNPDYALLLSWHYAAPIIEKLRSKGLRSKIIVPLPELHVID